MTPVSGTSTDPSVFAASQLGPFLRAMADPEGVGLPQKQEQQIARIKARVSEGADHE